ncbi:hypothetical protein PLICRDRAFT_508026 [Plicaturopsis crispa FD-325 SS-3]|nr:hypothetical protein PLICRDRAFT_508026 [Plicaturopsis crispa FD-325 SS-3]
MRPLSLHVSALNDAEYALYIPSLTDLALAEDQKQSNDDAYFEGLTVGVREARAWLRGRYSDVSTSDIDTILKYFHPNLGQTDCLTGGQFFAALRLVLHAEQGKGVDKGLAFVQGVCLLLERLWRQIEDGAHPESGPSRPPSPPKKRASQHGPPPRPPPLARPLSPLKQAPPPPARRTSHHSTPSLSNPFRPSAERSTPAITSSDDTALLPPSNNPFVTRAKSMNAGTSISKAEGRTPPLPPRKPVFGPPPRHASLGVSPAASTSSQRPVIPSFPPSGSIKTTHVTSPLMRQSLQASKAGQTMKRAEEQLERERIMQVLKSSSATSVHSSSPPRRFTAGSASTTATSDSDDLSLDKPPLPRRRRSPPPPSSASLEEVAGAYDSYRRQYTSPFRSAPGDRDSRTSPFSGSPTYTTTDLPAAPPTHPDRRQSVQLSEDSDPSWPPTPNSTRVSRSKSMHQQSPPPIPPPRRRRPESFQLAPNSSVENSPFTTPPQPNTSLLTRHVSLTAPNGRDPSETSPMANLQRTFANLHTKAQPRLDAARYKAEAGLSRRGYVNHAGGPWSEEGERGLMTDERGRDDGNSIDLDQDVFADEGYSDEGEGPDERGRTRDLRDADSLKWPAGDGWKPLT